MKKRELKKKLNLNKQVIVKINQHDLQKIKGGKKVPTGSVCSIKPWCPEIDL